jgi:hypothetical protein
LGTSRSLEAPLPSRVSPVRRDGYSTSSSPLVEHTRRVAMEAQAFRTRVRLQDLERAAHNGEGTHQDQEDMLLDDDSELRILRSFIQESPTYPNTEARQNVTVRRSRDRLSGRSSEIRTPEAVTGRRSSLRERDRRYSLEASQKMPANTLARDNEEELRASYQDVNLRPDDLRQISSSPGEIEERATPHRTATGHQVSGSGSKVIELLNRPRLKESRKTSSPDVLLSPPGFFASSSNEQEQSSSPHLGDMRQRVKVKVTVMMALHCHYSLVVTYLRNQKIQILTVKD